jgi:hypothetical protein
VRERELERWMTKQREGRKKWAFELPSRVVSRMKEEAGGGSSCSVGKRGKSRNCWRSNAAEGHG